MARRRTGRAARGPHEAALTPRSDFATPEGALEWLDDVWPFMPEPEEAALSMLLHVPGAVTQEFPHLSQDALGVLRADVWRARQHIADGHNSAFEREVRQLVRVLHASRAELVALSTVDVPVCDWARATAAALIRQRPAVNRALRVYRGALKAMPWLAPEGRVQIEWVIQYLTAIPTQRALRRWQRRHGAGRRDPWGAPVWTECLKALDSYLAPLVVRAKNGGLGLSEADRERIWQPLFAENASARLLSARYPAIVPENAGRLIAQRLRRR